MRFDRAVRRNGATDTVIAAGAARPGGCVVKDMWGRGAAALVALVAVAFGLVGAAAPASAQPVSTAPTGSVDGMRAGPDGVFIGGWALDPDGPGTVTVAAFSSGSYDAQTSQVANQSRPDVAAAFPGYGDAHGFQMLLAAAPGDNWVCVDAYDTVGLTMPTQLGCQTVHVPSGDPFGSLDIAAPARPLSTDIRIAGWAIDPDAFEPIQVAVMIDGTGGWILADRSRPDVALSFPGYGDRHGFDITLPSTAGSHEVCMAGINEGGGSNVLIGCKTVVVPDSKPFGFLDGIELGDATDAGRAAVVSGWAIDPDTTAPIQVAVYVDAAGAWYRADASRPDVGAVYPTFGSQHGFEVPVVLPWADPPATVCVWAINAGPGDNVLLGCRDVTPQTPVD
jgi:hypothetical protein